MPGYDPILDGTAAPYYKEEVRERVDGVWEWDAPNGETLTADGWVELSREIRSWYRRHPEVQRKLETE
jgi:hypothetical protein